MLLLFMFTVIFSLNFKTIEVLCNKYLHLFIMLSASKNPLDTMLHQTDVIRILAVLIALSAGM